MVVSSKSVEASIWLASCAEEEVVEHAKANEAMGGQDKANEGMRGQDKASEGMRGQDKVNEGAWDTGVFRRKCKAPSKQGVLHYCTTPQRSKWYICVPITYMRGLTLL